MYTEFELKLLADPPAEFPFLQAVAARAKECSTCGHGNVNIHSLLRIAINKYKSDKRFIEHCSTLFPLPCAVAGVLIPKEVQNG